MNVITENSIIIQRKGKPLDAFWSPASGKVKGKVKDFVQSGKAQSILDTLLQGRGNSQGPTDVTPTAPTPPPAKKGLSTGAKIGIAVGIAAVIGVGIYLYKHKKK